MMLSRKPSELLRKGAEMVDGQCQYSYFSVDTTFEVPQRKVVACALAAMAIAEFGYPDSHRAGILNAARVRKDVDQLPGMEHGEVSGRNDTGQTFEQIADWLEKEGL